MRLEEDSTCATPVPARRVSTIRHSLSTADIGTIESSDDDQVEFDEIITII